MNEGERIMYLWEKANYVQYLFAVDDVTLTSLSQCLNESEREKESAMDQ